MKANLVLFIAILFSGNTTVAQAEHGTPSESKDSIISPTKVKLFDPWSAGLRLAHIYDINSARFNTPLEVDLYGLNGPKTNFDLGLDLYVERMFTPLIGLRAGLRLGYATGANNSQYYEGQFSEFDLTGVWMLSNLDWRRIDSRWNFLITTGLAFGAYDSQRYLIASDDLNGDGEQGNYLSIRIGGGVQYELSAAWRLELDFSHNGVLNDGFDGYNANDGYDSYFSTGIGVAYTFGSRERPNLYSTNYYQPPFGFFTKNNGTDTGQGDRRTSRSKIAAMQREIDSLRKASNGVNTILEEIQTAKVDTIYVVGAAASEEVVKTTMVYFSVNSSVLTSSDKKILMENFLGKSGALEIVAYADRTGTEDLNEKLRKRRADSVKDFLVNKLGYPAEVISTKMGSATNLGNDRFLNRRVEIRMLD